MKNRHSRKLFASFALLFLLSFSAANVHSQNMFRKVNDFDGDGRADFAVVRLDGNGFLHWWIWQTTGGLKTTQWGIFGDRTAAGDYDGDGKTDIAVWRPADTNGDSSTFYILESASNTFRFQTFFHFISSQPMHQDYNGDGKTDPGVATGETNINLRVVYSGSSSGFTSPFPTNHSFGLRIGDMDGDRRADRVTFRSNGVNNLKITNLETNVTRDVQFGLFEDKYQLADFDGDGIGDLTVFRQSDGTWWWIRSSDNVVSAVTWGQDGDMPVAADYDGDGKTDLAIYRRGQQGIYWILGSRDGAKAFPWGTGFDLAVAY